VQPQKTTATNKQQREAKSQQNKINDTGAGWAPAPCAPNPTTRAVQVDIAGVTSVASGGIGKFAVVH
jgi:hypothetical protein